MKIFAGAALAGALAAAVVLPSASGAEAGYRHWNGPYRCYNCGWSPGGAFVTGAFLGLGIAALSSPYYYPPPPAYYGPPPPRWAPSPAEAHIDWCSATYRSYSAESDTWVDRNGVVRPCLGP